jgi:hypothetical protein
MKHFTRTFEILFRIPLLKGTDLSIVVTECKKCRHLKGDPASHYGISAEEKTVLRDMLQAAVHQMRNKSNQEIGLCWHIQSQRDCLFSLVENVSL